MTWKSLSYSKKGLLIGIGMWLILFLLLKIGGLFGCELPTNEFGEIPLGIMCLNNFQEVILSIFYFIGIPILLLGGTPNLSTSGPNGVAIFYIGNLVWFAVLGLFIGWLISKIKKSM